MLISLPRYSPSQPTNQPTFLPINRVTMSSKLPSDSAILEQIKCLVREINIQDITIKQFIRKLSSAMGVNLKEKKNFIKDSLTKILNEDQDESDSLDDNEEEEVDEEEEDGDDDELEKAPKAKRGWAAVKKELSPQLAEFLGKNEETRPQVVKSLWDYIKKNNLQNPDNRKEIQFDETLRSIFKVDGCSMIHLSKYISAHVHPFKPVDLKTKKKTLKKNQQDKKSKSKKRKGANDKAKEGGEKKKRKQKLYLLSDDLKKVVGEDLLSRPEVIKRLWVYIRENNLQNPEDKRQIQCDELLKNVMAGNDTVTIFSLNKYFGTHLMEYLFH